MIKVRNIKYNKLEGLNRKIMKKLMTQTGLTLFAKSQGQLPNEQERDKKEQSIESN